MKKKIKWISLIVGLMILVIFEPCGLIGKRAKAAEVKTENEVKVTEKTENKEKVNKKKEYKIKVSGEVLETKSISEVRDDAEKSMSVLGADSSKYYNIAKTDIIPIITDRDEIYKIKLTKLDGNELKNGNTFESMVSSREIINTYKVYRNDKERVKTKINITNGTDIKDLIEFAENYMNATYKKSPFKWIAETVEVVTAYDKKDYARINIRPSYDGVVFKRTALFKDGKPTDLGTCAMDFRTGTLYVTDMNKIYEYRDISPYYKVERQGEAINQIISVESVLSIVANKIDKKSVSDIRVFELAYMLNRDLSAVPIWNIVIRENGSERNFQIDAVTGYVYFE